MSFQVRPLRLIQLARPVISGGKERDRIDAIDRRFVRSERNQHFARRSFSIADRALDLGMLDHSAAWVDGDPQRASRRLFHLRRKLHDIPCVKGTCRMLVGKSHCVCAETALIRPERTPHKARTPIVRFIEVPCERAYFLYAEITASPSAPAFFSQSAVSWSPTFLRPDLNVSPGGCTFMPRDLSCSIYQPALSCHIFQPRVSAVAAALSKASW